MTVSTVEIRSSPKKAKANIKIKGKFEKQKAKFIFFSSSEIYGDPHVHPQPETYWGAVNPIGVRACYDEGKRMAETIFFNYRDNYDIDIRVARIFNTYGPNMEKNDGRVISNFIVQALKGENITIYGDGKQTRSFCYVDDMINGLTLLMNSNFFRKFKKLMEFNKLGKFEDL